MEERNHESGIRRIMKIKKRKGAEGGFKARQELDRLKFLILKMM